jgi:FkbM family methyltransferase
VLIPWINNTALVVETGMTGATLNIYCGLHEATDMAFLLHLLRPGDTFLDIGANVGTYTILASGAVGANAISIEPVPSTYTKLIRNLRLNNLDGLVIPLCTAVGGEVGSISFTASFGPMNHVSTSIGDGPVIDVPLTTVDSVLENTASTILWKIDVEGFEESVLNGAEISLRSHQLKAVILEADSSILENVMSKAGFQRYEYEPFARALSRASHRSSRGHNQLWISDIDYVQNRISSAPSFQIFKFII